MRNVDPGIEKLAKIEAPRIYAMSAAMRTMHTGGEIWVSTGTDGHTIRLVKAGVPVKFVPARTGDKRGVGMYDVFDVVKGTKVRELAQEFLNQLYSAEVQLTMAKTVGYSPVNREAAEIIRKDPELSKTILVTSEEKIKELFIPDWKYVYANYADWMEKWNRKMRR